MLTTWQRSACMHVSQPHHTHFSKLFAVHANHACALAIYSSFHLHTCTDFLTPTLHSGLSHVASMPQHVRSPCGLGAAARPLPTCRSTWFVRLLHNLLHSVTHHEPGCEFEFRSHACETCAPHTCNQACRHVYIPWRVICTMSVCAVSVPLRFQQLPTINILQQL